MGIPSGRESAEQPKSRATKPGGDLSLNDLIDRDYSELSRAHAFAKIGSDALAGEVIISGRRLGHQHRIEIIPAMNFRDNGLTEYLGPPYTVQFVAPRVGNGLDQRVLWMVQTKHGVDWPYFMAANGLLSEESTPIIWTHLQFQKLAAPSNTKGGRGDEEALRRIFKGSPYWQNDIPPKHAVKWLNEQAAFKALQIPMPIPAVVKRARWPWKPRS
jgi:hypothetical protein